MYYRSRTSYRAHERGTIVDELPGVIYLHLSLETWRNQRQCQKLPSVKYRLWLEQEGESYSPSKSKQVFVPPGQRDECWLECNVWSHGSTCATFKLSHADQLSAQKMAGFLVMNAKPCLDDQSFHQFGFGCIISEVVARALSALRYILRYSC